MRSIKNVLFSLILLIEAAALVASYYVNRYAYVRAGLYRHFHYRRTQFEQTILSDTLRMFGLWWHLFGLPSWCGNFGNQEEKHSR